MNGEILNTIESVKRYITPISGIKNPLIGLIIRCHFFFLSGKLKIILYEWRNSEHHRVSQTIYYSNIGNKESIDRFDNVIRCHFFFLSGKLKIILYEWRNSEHHRVSQTIYYADIGNKESIDRFDNVIRCHFLFFFIRQVENYSL